jgi:hypothetical protein
MGNYEPREVLTKQKYQDYEQKSEETLALPYATLKTVLLGLFSADNRQDKYCPVFL